MSRILGNKARHKRQHQTGERPDVSHEAKGIAMFERGEPCPPKSRDHGKEHATWRGWMRAAAAARTRAKRA